MAKNLEALNAEVKLKIREFVKTVTGEDDERIKSFFELCSSRMRDPAGEELRKFFAEAMKVLETGNREKKKKLKEIISRARVELAKLTK